MRLPPITPGSVAHSRDEPFVPGHRDVVGKKDCVGIVIAAGHRGLGIHSLVLTSSGTFSIYLNREIDVVTVA